MNRLADLSMYQFVRMPMRELLIIALICVSSLCSYSQTITYGEYFFDSDPGVGNGLELSFLPATTINQTFNIPTGILTEGFHTFNARVQDNTGKWSLFTTRTFYIIPNPFSGSPSINITKAEYFYDSDPGIGNGTNIPVTASPTANLTINTPTTVLSAGFHTVNVRVRDDRGRWSLFTTRTFYLMPASVLPSNLVKLEYYVDTDPGIGQATSVNVPAAPSVNQLFNLNMPILAPGNYTLNVRVKDSNGFWSSRVSAPFAIVPCTPPTAPTAAGVTRCDPGSVTLTATGASGVQVYRWYANASTGTILFTGASFVTPSISATTTYFVSVFDPATCESTRTPVAATISGLCPQPPIITTQSIGITIGGTTLPLNLLPFISTFNSTVVVSSILVVTQPPSGARANVVDGVLTIDYTGLSFVGRESITIRACDTNGNCTTQLFEIEVIGDIVIYNAVSPNGDGKNEFFRLQYIESISPKNQVSIYNRWGDEVFLISDYDNKTRVFAGLSSGGSKLPAGIYFYKITLASDQKIKTGFISLK